MNQTNERAFETQAEAMLTEARGWHSGSNSEWDVSLALFPARAVAFLKDT